MNFNRIIVINATRQEVPEFVYSFLLIRKLSVVALYPPSQKATGSTRGCPSSAVAGYCNEGWKCEKGIRRSFSEGGCASAGSAVGEGATGYARGTPRYWQTEPIIAGNISQT